MHQVRQHGSATAFLEAVEPMLLEREAEYNLLLGVIEALARQEQTGHAPMMNRPIDPVALLMTVEKAGEALVCAVRTPPYRLILSHGTEAALSALADHLAELDPRLPGVLGPAASGQAFARRWGSLTGAGTTSLRGMRILQLDDVIWPSRIPAGSFREAEAGDAEELKEWISSFGDEVGEAQDGEALARSRIKERALFVWDDDGLRSMAATARRSRNGCSVNLVYTPEEHRGRGYASACVAAISDRILKSGFAHCSLYTDAANPTSNRVYEQIGYRYVGESEELGFTEPVGESS